MSDSKAPSDLFMQAVIHTGSISVDCELCGRTHFSTDEPYRFDKGELENLLEKEEQNPEKYISHAYSLRWGNLNGKQAVEGCECDLARPYEDFFWSHRYIIMDYLRSRFDEMKESAQMQDEALKEVEESQSAVEATI